MKLFYKITPKFPISKTELNRGVFRGFPEGKTDNRSPEMGYFTMGRAWFCHEPSLFPEGIVNGDDEGILHNP